MAAVTVVKSDMNVTGRFRAPIYQVTGNSGDYLDTGLTIIKKVNLSSTLTGYSVAALAAPRVGTRITFTASGAFTAAPVEVIGT